MNDSFDDTQLGGLPEFDDDQVLGEIHVSPGRRLLGVLSFGAASVLLVYCAVTLPALPITNRMLLALVAVGAGALGWKLHIATEAHLILTPAELRSSTGEVLARLDDVARVEKGMLALKPSNGFALRLQKKHDRSWRPGLWTRWGRRVFVGGVTRAAHTRPVADMIAILIAQKSQEN